MTTPAQSVSAPRPPGAAHFFARLLPALFTLLLALALAAPAASAQATVATGTIEGRVQNVTNGQYVKSAQVAVEGTALVTHTNQFGEYQLAGVPAGPAKLTVTYGGLDSQTARVSIGAGQTAQQDFSLTRASAATDGAVRLDAFTVSAERDTNATSIATNEQRFAPNIKNVVSVDAFGDVNEGNAAEFLKYLPGISVNYIASNANSVSVRGFDPAFTTVNMDGARVANASLSNAGRTVDFFTVNTNQVSRVEVVKVPTPDRPADSLGGSVNMISRSAFEYARPQFSYRAYFNLNSQYRQLSPTPGPFNGDSWKILPGGEFNYVRPISRTLGFVVNGLVSNQFNVQRRTVPGWTFNSGGTITNPYYRSFQLQDGPANVFRRSVSLKTDWKFAPRQTLSLTLSLNLYKLQFSNRLFNAQAGINPVAYDPTFTRGALGLGTVNANNAVTSNFGTVALQNNSTRRFYQDSKMGVLNYRLDGRDWKIDAGVSPSNATAYFRDRSKGHLQSVVTNLVPAGSGAGLVPLAVRFDHVTYPAPGGITVTDSAGRVIDYKDQSNYRAMTVNSNPTNGAARVRDLYANVSRLFNAAAIPLTLKAGLNQRSDSRDNRRTNDIWTVVGPDRIPNTADDSVTALGLLDTNYINQNNYYGYRNFQYPSVYKAHELWKAHPEYFVHQAVNSETNRITGSERFIETVTAAYAQIEGRFLKNRLHLLTGVRWEKTEDEGLGNRLDPNAAFQRNANGSFVDGNPALAGIQLVRRPEAGAAGSLEELGVIRKERAYASAKAYDDYYPSVHANFDATDHTKLRFAFSQTLGRPDLPNIIPTATINENSNFSGAAGTFPGTITVTNTGLKPWSAKNYDISLEHYFGKGGLGSVSLFRKDIADFWGNLPAGTVVTPEIAAAYGLEQQYVNWQLNSRVNVGSVRIDGLELNYQQKLNFAFLPAWASHFSLNANATQLHLQGARDADFNNFVSRMRNVGLTYAAHGIVAKVNYNNRGRQKRGAVPALGTDAYSYFKQRDYVDVNLEYTWSKRLQFFAVARNITNVPQDQEQYGAQTPSYARYSFGEEFGVQFNFGVKGTF